MHLPVGLPGIACSNDQAEIKRFSQHSDIVKWLSELDPHMIIHVLLILYEARNHSSCMFESKLEVVVMLIASLLIF